MLAAFAKRFLGSHNDRFLKRLEPKVEAINALEGELEPLSADELKARTLAFKERLAAGETLDDILVEAFATVREAARKGAVFCSGHPTVPPTQQKHYKLC